MALRFRLQGDWMDYAIYKRFPTKQLEEVACSRTIKNRVRCFFSKDLEWDTTLWCLENRQLSKQHSTGGCRWTVCGVCLPYDLAFMAATSCPSDALLHRVISKADSCAGVGLSRRCHCSWQFMVQGIYNRVFHLLFGRNFNIVRVECM